MPSASNARYGGDGMQLRDPVLHTTKGGPDYDIYTTQNMRYKIYIKHPDTTLNNNII